MRKFVVKKLLQHCNKNTSLYSIGFFFFFKNNDVPRFGC